MMISTEGGALQVPPFIFQQYRSFQAAKRKEVMEISYEVRVYGKNRKNPTNGGRSYWTNIDSWKRKRMEYVGRSPVTVNVTSKSTTWGKFLSPMLLGPVETYQEGSETKMAINVEVAWQYSKVYTQEKNGKGFRPLWFQDGEGNPNDRWFEWRDNAWANPRFSFKNKEFEENKAKIRRAFPKGSKVGFWYWAGEKLDQISARREIYGRLYSREVQKTEPFRMLKDILRENDLLIYDIDGYDYVELGMTPDDTIRDLDHSWGHGLVLSLLLKGIDPTTLGGSTHG